MRKDKIVFLGELNIEYVINYINSHHLCERSATLIPQKDTDAFMEYIQEIT